MMSVKQNINNVVSSFINSFNSHLFDPLWYITEFYPPHIGTENLQLIIDHINICHEIKQRTQDLKESYLLDLGGGGTLWAEMIYGQYVGKIDYTDYLVKNLHLINSYLKTNSNHTWDPYIKLILELEGNKYLGEDSVQQHAENIKLLIENVDYCDVFSTYPVANKKKYDITLANFVMESVTSHHATWMQLMKNASNTVSKDGFLVVSAIEKAKGYSSDSSKELQNAVFITLEELLSAMEKLGFEVFYSNSIAAETDHLHQYEGLAVCAGQYKVVESR